MSLAVGKVAQNSFAGAAGGSRRVTITSSSLRARRETVARRPPSERQPTIAKSATGTDTRKLGVGLFGPVGPGVEMPTYKLGQASGVWQTPEPAIRRPLICEQCAEALGTVESAATFSGMSSVLVAAMWPDAKEAVDRHEATCSQQA